METYSIHKGAQIAPRKARMTLDLIRGKSVSQAEAILLTTNTKAIAKINGSADAEGSLANTLKQAKDYADTKVSDVSNLVANKVDKVEGSTLIPETKLALIDTNASDIDALEVRVAANEAKLVGITTTVVSTINTAIDAAMAWHEVTE